MDGIEKLREKIIKDSQVQAMSIEQESQQYADKVLAAGEVELSRRAERFEKELETEATKLEKRIADQREMENRDYLLKRKQAIIEGIFEQTLERLRAFSGEVYEEWLIKVLVEAEIEDEAEVLFSEKDRILGERVLEKVREERQKIGKKANLFIADEEALIAGGFILKTQRYEMDQSFEALLKALRGTVEKDLVEILFRDNNTADSLSKDSTP